jgi:uncharacterized membrane protein
MLDKNDRAIGLVDGTYAIIITLFALEFPGNFIKVLEGKEEIEWILCFYFILYVGIFMILYDTWILHKSALLHRKEEQLKLVDTFSAIAMVTAVLIPGIMQTGMEWSIEKSDLVHSSHAVLTDDLRIIDLGLFTIIYFLLWRLESRGTRNRKSWKAFCTSAFSRFSLFFAALVISLFLLPLGFSVPLAVVLTIMVVLGILFSDPSERTVTNK